MTQASPPSKDAATCQSCHRESTAELTVCMDQRDTCEPRENKICALDTLPLSPSCHGTLYLLLLYFPYYVNCLIVQVSVMSFFFKALMIWNYQVHLLMDFFLLSASQSSVYSVDAQIPLGADAQTSSKDRSHWIYELLGQKEISFHVQMPRAQFWLLAVLGSHASPQPQHWERALWLTCDVCHEWCNKYPGVLLTLYSSYIT